VGIGLKSNAIVIAMLVTCKSCKSWTPKFMLATQTLVLPTHVFDLTTPFVGITVLMALTLHRITALPETLPNTTTTVRETGLIHTLAIEAPSFHHDSARLRFKDI